jgi:hypothetical protein
MAVFMRLWDAHGHGRLDDALDPTRAGLRASVSRRVYRGHDGAREAMADFRRRWKSVTLTGWPLSSATA